MSRRSLPLLLAVALAGLFAASPLAAQSNADLKAKVDALERRVATLQNQVTLLRDRIQSLLGTERDYTVQEIPIGQSAVRGPAQAPVTLVMFGDFQSDYTVRAHYMVGRLLETYPQRLRFVYKHYPLAQQHPMANDAALAALAAGRQGRYWEMHDLLMRNSRRLDGPLLVSLAEQLGLDLSRFDVDRRSLWALERLDADEKLGARLGLDGVPTLYLNGRLLDTFRFDYVKAQVDEALAR